MYSYYNTAQKFGDNNGDDDNDDNDVDDDNDDVGRHSGKRIK